MLVEHLFQRALVVAPHRGDLAAVDVEGLAVLGPAARVRVPDRGEASADTAHRGLDRLVAAAPDERAVEHRVGSHHARPLSEVPLEEVDGSLELDEVGGGRGAHRLVRHRPLEHAARAQDVDGGLLLELHRREDGHGRDEVGDDEDPSRLPATHLDEPGELEHPERLAQGGLGDAELLRERALVREPVAGAQPGPLDRLGEVLDRRLERPRGAYRLDRERPWAWHARSLAGFAPSWLSRIGVRHRFLSRGNRAESAPVFPQEKAAALHGTGNAGHDLGDMSETDDLTASGATPLDRKRETLFHFGSERRRAGSASCDRA